MKYCPQNTKICVIGGGNVGTQFACICSSKGYSVNIYTSSPEKYDGTLEMVNEYEEVITGKVNKVTSDIEEALSGCQIVFVTYPAFRLRRIGKDIIPYIKNDMIICVLPGTGGAEFAFRKCMKAGASLVGLQRVPTVSRLEEYGKRVRCEGLRPSLHIASIPSDIAPDFSGLLTDLFGIPCDVMPNYLNVTLTPSNPVLHTTRLRTLFSDYSDGKIYERNPLFYGEWSDESSELLLACDDELQKMIKTINDIDLHYVKSLKIHYESSSAQELTKKMRSIKSLHNLASPMKHNGFGWVPDFESRYFAADFPYGLAIIEEFASVLNVNVPNINETMDWYRKVTGDNNQLELREYGIYTKDDIYDLY